MLEIILAVFAILFIAHRKAPKRRYYLRKVRVTPELPLLTLGSDTALTITMTGVSTDAYRAVTFKATWSLIGLTGNQGPITIGYAHSDYSVAEIKACLEASAAISQSNKTVNEAANRLVRVVGVLTSGLNQLNDGRPVKTRLNWKIGIGESVVAFAFNEDTDPLTTGAILNIQGDLWVKD